MSTFVDASKNRQIDGAVIVLSTLLRDEHPAVAAAHIARVLAAARVPADLTLLGAAGDIDVVTQTLDCELAMTSPLGDAWAISSGAELRVLEARDDDSEVLS